MRNDAQAAQKKAPEPPPPTPSPVATISDGVLEVPRHYEPPEELPWPADPDDRFMTPFPSFINDFAYSMKGKESPPLFNIFAALWCISTASTRKSFFRWALDALWPNIYVLVVADPSYCHKGAAMGKAEKLLRRLSSAFPGDPIMASEKKFNFMNSNTSPEFMFDMLEPRTEHFILPNGTIHKENFGSSLTIWASELTTLINTKKYVAGMIENLTSWFDCEDDKDSGTKSTGKKKIKNLYITLAGALTPAQLRQNLPQEAYTTGFMSRCIVVYQQKPSILWPEPVDFEGTPSRDELLQRLTWLCYNIRGEYDWTPEAREYYHQWYVEHQTKIFRKETTVAYYARARFTQTVIRVATLLRMAEYRPGRDVGIEHLRHSITLLEHVFMLQEPITADVDVAPEAVPYVRVREYIRKEVQVTRAALLRRMSARGVLVAQVNAALIQLRQENRITFIFNERTRDAMEPLTNTKEIYQWISEP